MNGHSFASPRGIRAYSKDIIVVVAVVVVAAFLRVQSAVHIGAYPLYGDMVHYDESARAIIDKHIFTFWGYGPDAYVTPGYPLFLAVCYRVALWFTNTHSGQMLFTMIVQALLAAITAGIVYAIARLVLPLPFATLGTGLWTFYLPAVWSPRLFLTETLYVFFLMAFIWTFTLSLKQRSYGWWIASGLLLGLCSLVRPTVFPLIVAGAIVTLLHLRDGVAWRTAFLRYGLQLAAFLLPLVPWWVRNYRLFHHLVLSDTEIGNPLLFGSDPYFASGPLLGHGLSQMSQKQLAIHRILFGFTHQPWLYFRWYTFGKLGILFGKPWYPPLGLHPKWWLAFWLNLHLVWVTLGVIGILIGFWVKQVRVLTLFTLFLILVQLPFIPVNRYAFPVMPLLFIGVGVLAHVITTWVSKRYRPGGSAT